MVEPLSAVQQIEQKIATLNDMLLKNHPQMPQLLQEIHKRLHPDPELAHLITEEQVGMIVSALSKHTQTYIVQDLIQAKVRAKKKDWAGADLGMDGLGSGVKIPGNLDLGM